MTSPAPSESIPLIELPSNERTRGVGTLEVGSGAQAVRLPLASVDINASAIDRVASVTVTQKFRNNLSEHLEAVYIFPLAPSCAVSNFEMKVGQRTIKGVVQERAQARQNYQKAMDEGKRAALMEQERDDVFTVHVGNLPPGEEVLVTISYSERLPYFEDGKTELRLPLVVAPRYIPGSPVDRDQTGEGVEIDTDVVPDASRISPPRLAPGFNPHVDLSIRVELAYASGTKNGAVGDLTCSQHATKLGLDSGAIAVELSRTDERLDRDFVLRWRLGTSKVTPSLVTYKDEDGTYYGMLSIFAPVSEKRTQQPRDIVFVVDRSGSMAGIKMTSAARACSHLLASLGPDDRFAIQSFDDRVEWLTRGQPNAGVDPFVCADEPGIERGIHYLRGIDARGGTELNQAMEAALRAIDTRKESTGRVTSIVLLTDGEVGDESRILKSIQTMLGDARLFVVGVDTSVNDGLLKRMANLGRGTASFVQPGSALEDALCQVSKDLGNPIVENLIIEAPGTVDPATLAPARLPDLFAGRAATIFFKMAKAGPVRVKGALAGGGTFDEKVSPAKAEAQTVAHLWAKAHVLDLEDRYRTEPNNQDTLKKQIIAIALKHSLLTRFTAFIVVDETEVVNADGSVRKVVQPVENPADWDMLSADTMAQTAGMPALLGGAMGIVAQSCSAPAGAGWGAAGGAWGGAADELSMQPQAPAAPAPSAKMARLKGAGSLWDAFGQLISGGGQPPKSEASLRGRLSSDEPAKLKKLLASLELLAVNLEKARGLDAVARKQAIKSIQKEQKDLTDLLASTKHKSRLPLTQAWLSIGLTAMVALIAPDKPQPADFMNRWTTLMDELESAMQEVSSCIATLPAASPDDPKFWDLTI